MLQISDISLSIVNYKAMLSPALYLCVCIISPKHGSMLNTRSNDFVCRHIECVTLHKRGNCPSGAAVKGEGGVAG